MHQLGQQEFLEGQLDRAVEPGSITSNRPFATPAAARENHAAAPTCSTERARNISPKPGSSRWTSGASASGVTSRFAMPVPPVTITQSTARSSSSAATARRMGPRSSRTHARAHDFEAGALDQLVRERAAAVERPATRVADRDDRATDRPRRLLPPCMLGRTDEPQAGPLRAGPRSARGGALAPGRPGLRSHPPRPPPRAHATCSTTHAASPRARCRSARPTARSRPAGARPSPRARLPLPRVARRTGGAPRGRATRRGSTPRARPPRTSRATRAPVERAPQRLDRVAFGRGLSSLRPAARQRGARAQPAPERRAGPQQRREAQRERRRAAAADVLLEPPQPLERRVPGVRVRAEAREHEHAERPTAERAATSPTKSKTNGPVETAIVTGDSPGGSRDGSGTTVSPPAASAASSRPAGGSSGPGTTITRAPRAPRASWRRCGEVVLARNRAPCRRA